MIRVAISGSGKMGRQVRDAVDGQPDMEAVGFVDALAEPGECEGLTLLAQPDDLFDIRHPDVVVDFSNAAFTPQLTKAALKRGIRPVIGTSGLAPDFVRDLEAQCGQKQLGGVVAANFALGAVLMMHFAAQAARFYDSAEVIELHHDQKVDAPSGTALETARAMARQRGQEFRRNVPERENLPGARSASEAGVTIHSVRLPGLLAHQEVLLGGSGELLTIRHDTMSRESFMPGVLMAVRKSMELDHMVVGLDRLIGLG